MFRYSFNHATADIYHLPCVASNISPSMDKQLRGYVSLQLFHTFAVDVFVLALLLIWFLSLWAASNVSAGQCVYLGFSHHNGMLNLDYRSDPQWTVVEVESIFATCLCPDCPLSQRIEQPMDGICIYFSSHAPQTAHCTYYTYCDHAVVLFPSGIQITYTRLYNRINPPQLSSTSHLFLIPPTHISSASTHWGWQTAWGYISF